MTFISGIQQIGIGTNTLRKSLLAYKEHLGMDVLVFDDTSDASLMTRYTGDKIHQRRAILTLNMQGGGGFELWQFESRSSQHPCTKPAYGDLGIFAAKLKSSDVTAAHNAFSKVSEWAVTPIQKDPAGKLHFWLRDSAGNEFNVITSDNWFGKSASKVGGVCGAVIGVSDIDRSMLLYKDILGIHEVVYDVTGNFKDIRDGSTQARYRRVLLRKKSDGKGAFGKLLGDTEIELVQCLDRTPVKIFADRFWGDCGFIHLCFDVLDMDGLKDAARQQHFPFTVDSEDSFAMEDAAGRFCYLEDPDGTLIELVETHKVPIMKKWGLYLNLKKRSLEKPLPNWIVKLLALNKVK